jgi:hypothetical protein
MENAFLLKHIERSIQPDTTSGMAGLYPLSPLRQMLLEVQSECGQEEEGYAPFSLSKIIARASTPEEDLSWENALHRILWRLLNVVSAISSGGTRVRNTSVLRHRAHVSSLHTIQNDQLYLVYCNIRS